MTQTTTTSPTTVAIIGCGPGGMFFLHALETKRRELRAKGDVKGLEALPSVTCLERASGPGGVWRSSRQGSWNNDQENQAPKEEKKDSKDSKTTSAIVPKTDSTNNNNMYEALWTNGAKENMELFDYTYQEHFGRDLSVFMPRQAILEYFTSRVTRKSPTLLQQYVRFNTLVLRVVFSNNKFQVTTKSLMTGQLRHESFEKCIWAAGENGKPFIPPNLDRVFERFDGTMIHSSQASRLDLHVRNKRVVMIGGSYSAEDLALMAIKLGVAKLYISSRTKDGPVTWTNHWPQDKVQLLTLQIPIAAHGKTVEFGKAKWNYDLNQYVTESNVCTRVHDIDTIIFCTGYSSNFDMLDKSLRPPKEPTELDDYSIPSTWSMTQNVFTPDLGEVPVGPVVYTSSSYVKPGLYQGVLMSNPSMMFCFGGNGQEPLLESDIIAYQMLAYIAGTSKLPCTVQEMTRRNNEFFQYEFQLPWYRYYSDVNYRRAVDELYKQEGHWIHNDKDELYKKLSLDHYTYPWLLTAFKAKEGRYPVDIGNFAKRKLSEIGTKYYEMSCKSTWLRSIPDYCEETQRDWRTFRDYDKHHGLHFVSVFTGNKSVPLKNKWMEIHANCNHDQEW